jgi:hypothetical protein
MCGRYAAANKTASGGLSRKRLPKTFMENITPKPQPGEVWLIDTGFGVSDRVIVYSKSRFWSWLLRKPQYWVNQGGWFKWLESDDVFLSCKEDL